MSNKQTPAPKTAKEWAKIEADYRAGVKSLRQIATDHGITEGAIRKRAKKEDWERDLAQKVKAKADALVRNATVRAEVREQHRVPESVIVDDNAQAVAGVMLSQRSDIKRNRALVMRLLEELEGVTHHGDTLEQMADMLLGDIDPEDKAAQARREKMLEAINKAISLSSRVDSMKKLADTLKVLVALEREAYNIVPEAPKGADGYEDLLDELGE